MHLKSAVPLSFALVLALLPPAHAEDLVKGVFRDAKGGVMKEFSIPDLRTAQTQDLASIFPQSCQPPLRFLADGRFYCSKGTGPHKLELSKGSQAELLQKLRANGLVK